MADKTGIQWTDATWNPVTGCTRISPGCHYCYIERTPPMRMAGRRFEIPPAQGPRWIPVQLHPERLDKPLHWRKPRKVFVVSMGDLFHRDVPDEFIAEIFDVMARAKQHTFQVLTKRPQRMRAWVNAIAAIPAGQCKLPGGYGAFSREVWPLPNVWLGVSAEKRRMADKRIPILLDTPAAKRFVSCEPLLGPLELSPWLAEPTGLARLRPYYQGPGGTFQMPSEAPPEPPHRRTGLDWVIVGGESGGPPERALVERCDHRFDLAGVATVELDPCGACGLDTHRRRSNGTWARTTGWRPKPEAREWLRAIRDQCQAAGVPLFLKQLGGPTPKAGGRTLDGRTWDEFPERVAVPA